MSVMAAEPRTSAVQIVGADGEVALGKEYAGRSVSVVMLEPGVWSVKVGTFVPDSERWLLDPEVQADLDEAIAWAERNPPRSTDLQEFEEKLFGEPRADSDSSRPE
jgi:hypothetical protein